jgi:photosystem II stability/assembly factor-like uncharacterized protein
VSSADGTKAAAVAWNQGIYTSNDSGNTWTRTSAPSQPWNTIVSSADGTKLLAGVDGGGLYRSTNSGTTWKVTSAPAGNWYGTTSSADGTILAAARADSRSMYVSTNSGSTWKLAKAPSLGWFSLACSADGTRIVATTYGSPIYTSLDSGFTWNMTGSPSNTWTMVASSADGSKLVAVSLDYMNGRPGLIYTLQTPPAPVLSLTPVSGGSAVLSWLVPSVNFALQQSSDFSSWRDVQPSPALNLRNLENQVEVPLQSSNRFYRLKH